MINNKGRLQRLFVFCNIRLKRGEMLCRIRNANTSIHIDTTKGYSTKYVGIPFEKRPIMVAGTTSAKFRAMKASNKASPGANEAKAIAYRLRKEATLLATIPKELPEVN